MYRNGKLLVCSKKLILEICSRWEIPLQFLAMESNKSESKSPLCLLSGNSPLTSISVLQNGNKNRTYSVDAKMKLNKWIQCSSYNSSQIIRDKKTQALIIIIITYNRKFI